MTQCRTVSCWTGVSPLVLSVMQWRQSANDRCSGSEQAACAVECPLLLAICFYPSTGHTCQRRHGSIETLLSSLSWLCPLRCLFNVQSGAWHWSMLTAKPASAQCMGGNTHSQSQEAKYTPLCFCFTCEASQVVFQLWQGVGWGWGASAPEDADHQFQRYETLHVFPSINQRIPYIRVQRLKPGLWIN